MRPSQRVYSARRTRCCLTLVSRPRRWEVEISHARHIRLVYRRTRWGARRVIRDALGVSRLRRHEVVR